MNFTEESCKTAKCPAGKKDVILFDDRIKGLGLRVTQAGKRIFLFQYRVKNVVRRTTIGAWGTELTVAQARRRAESLRGQVLDRHDPVAERKAKQSADIAAEAEARVEAGKAAYTVNALIEQWAVGRLAERSASYRKEAPKRLRVALADWLKAPAARLSHADVVAALDGMKAASGPVQANRVRAYGRAAFGWALARGTIPSNPFANAPRPVRERSRERALSDAELAEVWQAAGRLGEGFRKDHAEYVQYWTALIRILILTGQRRGEVAGMRWSELDLKSAEAAWILPGHRSKNGREHTVPLAPVVVSIIEALPRMDGCDLVMSGGRQQPPSGFGKVKLRLDAAIAVGRPADGPVMPEFTLHDLRRSVATGLQRLGTRLEVTEAILNHVSGSRAGIIGIYQRHKWNAEARSAAEGWANHIVAAAEKLQCQ